MKISYDPKADALYIRLRKEKADHSKEIDKNTILDFNKEGQVVGMELLFVKERNPDILKEVKVENLMVN